ARPDVEVPTGEGELRVLRADERGEAIRQRPHRGRFTEPPELIRPDESELRGRIRVARRDVARLFLERRIEVRRALARVRLRALDARRLIEQRPAALVVELEIDVQLAREQIERVLERDDIARNAVPYVVERRV